MRSAAGGRRPGSTAISHWSARTRPSISATSISSPAASGRPNVPSGPPLPRLAPLSPCRYVYPQHGRTAVMRSYKVSEFSEPLIEVDAPTPKPSGTEVVLKVKAAGVCHSDLHIWEGGYELGHGRGRLSLKDRGIPLPLTMGHETVGEVVAVGPKARGVKVGQVRLVYPWQGCGTCKTCKQDHENYCLTMRSLGVQCDGGYADHIVVRHPKYLVDLKGLDPVVAAPYACSGVTTYSALKKIADVFKKEPIVIFGAGGLGLMALSLHKAMGGKGVIMVDIDARKRDAAKKAGAMAVVDGGAADV